MRRAWILAALIAAAAFANVAQSQTLKFTVAQTVNANGSVTPGLTWCTEGSASSGTSCSGSGAAVACTASGDWGGAKGPAGSETLAPVTIGKSYTLACSWAGQDSIQFTWTPPTTNTDGSPLTDLAGYHVYYGTTPTMSVNQVKDIPQPGASSTVLGPGLAPGTWYVVLDSYNVAKVPSGKAPSPPLSKTLGSGVSVTQSVRVTFPNAPTNLTVQ
jgi:hypothetical protein